MRVLVTGASGWTASAILEALAGELFAPSRPENVYVNDKECEVIYNGDTNLVNLQLQKGYNKVEVEF